MYYTVRKHSVHFRTLKKYRKCWPAAHVFYISLVFSNAHCVLSQCNTQLVVLLTPLTGAKRMSKWVWIGSLGLLLYLLNKWCNMKTRFDSEAKGNSEMDFSHLVTPPPYLVQAINCCCFPLHRPIRKGT